MPVSSFLFRHLVYYPAARVQAGPVRARLRDLTKTQYQSRDELARLQDTRLRRLLEHARANVPFFADRLPAVPASGDLADIVAPLPFLRKVDLQQHGADLLSRAALGRLAPKVTGGSTGEPVTIWKTRDAWAWELAATLRGYAWAGVAVADLQARFWGVPQVAKARARASLIDFTCHRIRIPAFSFGEADLERYRLYLDRRRPRWFYGYVSMLTEFARYLKRTGKRLEFSPVAVVTTSEVLTPEDRQLLREVFGAPVFNEYGCGELGTIAHECSEGALHLSEENMLVEILDGERPCAPGESGEIVVTELNNLAFPLLRYRLGDYGFVAPEPCRCGRALRVLGSVHGRAYDFVRNRRGQLFHGEFVMYIFEDLRRQAAGIRQFQVEQTDLDAFTVRIVRADGYDPACEQLVVDRFHEHVDPEARLTFQYVEAIAREASGKLRVIKGLGA